MLQILIRCLFLPLGSGPQDLEREWGGIDTFGVSGSGVLRDGRSGERAEGASQYARLASSSAAARVTPM